MGHLLGVGRPDIGLFQIGHYKALDVKINGYVLRILVMKDSYGTLRILVTKYHMLSMESSESKIEANLVGWFIRSRSNYQ